MALKNKSYDWCLKLWLSYPCGHMIMIWALGNQFTFMTVTVSHGYMISIVTFSTDVWQAKSMGSLKEVSPYSCNVTLSNL